MKWFKHYSDAQFDGKMERFMAAEGKHPLEAYAFYFIIIELCAAQYDGYSESSKFSLSWKRVCSSVAMSRTRVGRLLDRGWTVGFWSWTSDEFNVEIDFPKLLKIRHKDSLSSAALDRDWETEF